MYVLVLVQEVGRGVRGERDDREDAAAGGGAEVRQGRIPVGVRGGGGARRAAPGEAARQRAAPLGAQVHPQATPTTTKRLS